MRLDGSVLLVVLTGWLGVALLRQLTLFGAWGPLELWTWVMILAFLACFLAGALAGRSAVPAAVAVPAPAAVPGRWQNRWVVRLALIALLGAVSLTFEFAVLRGYGFTTGAWQVRILEVENAGQGGSANSLFGGLGRLMVPALQLAWVLAMLGWGGVKGGARLVLFAATAVVFVEQFLFEGGRNFWVVLLAAALLARAADPRRRRIELSFRQGAILALALAFLLYVFVDRIASAGIDFAAAYRSQLDPHDVTAGARIYARFEAGAPGALYFAFAMLWLYITQGFYQLQVLLVDSAHSLAWGMYQFSVAGQILQKLTGIEVAYNVFEEIENVGTYPTLIGAGAVDFGIGGALALGAGLGFLMTAGLRRLGQGRLTWMALSAPIFAAVALFAPVVSLMPNAWIGTLWAAVLVLVAPAPRR